MFNLLKPYLGPFALFGFEMSMGALDSISEFWSGALIAFALFWFFLALTSHKALIKKWPNIKVWLPFVDPAGGVMAGSKELTGKYIYGHTFNIADVSYMAKIEDRYFESCHIYGPAILLLSGPAGQLFECAFEGHPDDIFILVSQQKVIGPIILINCTFKKCIFTGIGFIGNEQAKNNFLTGSKVQPTVDTQASKKPKV